MKIIIKIICFIIIIISNVYSQQFWQKLNGPPGGAIKTIAVSPSKKKMAIGTVEPGNIYISTNGGQNWIKSNYKNFNYNAVWNIVFVTDSILIAGSDRIYRSIDGGLNWSISHAPQFPNFPDVRALAVDSSKNIFVGVENGFAKIYRSQNYGLSWVPIYNFSNNSLYDIYIDHRNVIYVPHWDGIITSSDGGNTWKNSVGLTENSRMKQVTSNKAGLMFAINSDLPNDFYYSSDYGINWTKYDSTSQFWTNRIYFTNGKLYAIGDSGIIATTPFGQWEYKMNGLYHKRASTIINVEDTLYAATLGPGVFKSTDWGNNWFPIINGLNDATSTTLTFDEFSNIYATSYLNLPFKSTDKGSTWMPMSRGINVFELTSVYYSKNRTLYVGGIYGLFRSYDKGENFEKLNTFDNKRIVDITEDKRGNIYVCTNGQGVLRSTDNGDSWHLVSTSFIHPVSFSLTTDSLGYIYAGSIYGRVYRSTDSGNTWEQKSNGIPSTQYNIVSSLTTDLNGYIYASVYDHGIFRSTDRGESWHPKNNAIINKRVDIITANKKNQLFAADKSGYIYFSEDAAESWIKIGYNIFPMYVYDIKFDQNGYVYLGTNESIWKSTDTVFVSIKDKFDEELPTEFVLYQNYPNPFNSSTTISWQSAVGSLPDGKAGRQTIKLYDVLGREIDTIVDGYYEAGKHSTFYIINSTLPSGVYFYRLQAGNFSQTRKMIILR